MSDYYTEEVHGPHQYFDLGLCTGQDTARSVWGQDAPNAWTTSSAARGPTAGLRMGRSTPAAR